ncbi:kinase-like domain-containing protein [Xylariaceae sp. FL0016]|nr:kinase-like domain-containing protein [Xylariaceae sp. FL0016]
MDTTADESSSINFNLGNDLARNEARVAEIRDHFNRQTRFEFEGELGRGATGMAFKVKEKWQPFSRGRSRRLVVKRATKETQNDWRSLRREIDIMTKLCGSAHIAALIATRDDLKPPTRLGARLLRNAALLLRRQDSMLVGLRGPVLVLEYLENGDLSRLYVRLWRRSRSLPNRILWAFFVCMIRACIAMAYPPSRGLNARPRLETVPSRIAPGPLEHHDLHAGNIMVGAAGGEAEHALVPALKVIDFGEARQQAPAPADMQHGHYRNAWDMCQNILRLVTRTANPVRRTAEYGGYRTMATEVLRAPVGEGDRYPGLDDAFRDLMARCLAEDHARRPTLAEMLAAAREGAAKGAEAYAPNDADETDEAVRGALQTFVYDADDVFSRGDRNPFDDEDGADVFL